MPNFHGTIDFIRLFHTNGSTVEMNTTELRYLMSKSNDLTAVLTSTAVTGLVADEPSNVVYSYGFSAVINLLNVDKIEIVRESFAAEGNYEFITGNMK